VDQAGSQAGGGPSGNGLGHRIPDALRFAEISDIEDIDLDRISICTRHDLRIVPRLVAARELDRPMRIRPAFSISRQSPTSDAVDCLKIE
jgi:hypothetical protein